MNLSSGMSADKSADASADVLGRISQDFYSPIQWDKLTTCYQYGDREFPGVKCNGQEMPNDDDCLA